MPEIPDTEWLKPFLRRLGAAVAGFLVAEGYEAETTQGVVAAVVALSILGYEMFQTNKKEK
jgi:uncharacterized membrane protein YebE (DUF533 family)